MKVGFIFLLLLLVWWIVFNRYTKWRLELGIDFCARSEELIGIYNDYKNLESQNGTFELGQRYFVAEYNSDEIKEFFMQMEYALAVMFDQYDVIEKWSMILQRRIGIIFRSNIRNFKISRITFGMRSGYMV